MDKTKISKKMSYMLRHCTDPLYIDFNGGWADINIIIKDLEKKFPEVNTDIIEQIVAEDLKDRYSFDETHKKIKLIQIVW